MTGPVPLRRAPLTRPPVTITLDRVRTLRFDMNAGAAIEDTSGRTLPVLLGRGAVSVSAMRWLIWGLLLHEEPTLTPAAAGTLVQTYWFEQGKRLPELGLLVSEAIDRSWIYGPPLDTPDPADPEGGASPPSGIG